MQGSSIFSSQKIMIVVLFVSLLVAGIYFLGGKSINRKTIKNNGVSVTKAPTLTKRQIAESVLQWMNNTRTDNGAYAEGESCTNTGICDPLIMDNRIGAVSMWAQYQNYIKYKRFETLPIITNDLKTYNNTKLVSTIQPAFWNCKPLYEMWKSPVFNAKEKDELQVVCARAIYLPINVPQKPNSEKLYGSIITNAMKGIKSSSAFKQELNKKYLKQYAINASEQVYMSLWNTDLGGKGSVEDLALAKEYFIAALELYMKNPGAHTENLPLLGIAAFDISKADTKPEYLSFAKYVFETGEKKKCASSYECVLRMYLASELYRSTSSNIYLQARERLLHQMYTEMFDFQGLLGYALGRGALFENGLKNRYDMVTNALFSGLLSREE